MEIFSFCSHAAITFIYFPTQPHARPYRYIFASLAHETDLDTVDSIKFLKRFELFYFHTKNISCVLAKRICLVKDWVTLWKNKAI